MVDVTEVVDGCSGGFLTLLWQLRRLHRRLLWKLP